MTTRPHRHRSARFIGSILGIAVAVVAIAAWRVPDGWGTRGSQVSISVNRSGPLGVSPTGPVLTALNLRPGSAAVGRVRVRNQTAGSASLRLRAIGAERDLDKLLFLEIRAGDRVVFTGSLGALRTWTEQDVSLGSTATTTLALRAWLPTKVQRGYQGRVVHTELQLDTLATRA